MLRSKNEQRCFPRKTMETRLAHVRIRGGFIHCRGVTPRFSSDAVDNFVNILGALVLNA